MILSHGTAFFSSEIIVERQRPNLVNARTHAKRGRDFIQQLVPLCYGRLVLTHGPCKPPLRTPLTIRISNEDGQSWGVPLQLAEMDNHPQVKEGWVEATYPPVTQLDDGTLVVVWTEINMDDNDQYGNIWSARVHVPPAAAAVQTK